MTGKKIDSNVRNITRFARGKTQVHSQKYGIKKQSNPYAIRAGLPKVADKQKKTDYKKLTKTVLKKFSVLVSLLIFLAVGLSSLFLIGIVSAYSENLPDIDDYFAQSQTDGKETIIVDRKGKELYRLRGTKLQERVALEDVPEKLKWAFVAAEDAQFFNHQGVDFMGISRAALCTYKNEDTKKCGGGSSITQQLIKKTTGDEDPTLDRKTREAILAMRVEQKYTKEQILEFYLNIVPEGGVLRGVKAASKYLFGKESLHDLTLAEIAYLAAIPNEPAILSPLGGSLYNPIQSQSRANYVLDRMLIEKEHTKVTEEEIFKARSELPFVKFQPDNVSKEAVHFTDYVISELDKLYADKVGEGEKGSDYLRDKGYRIVTSVDLDIQNMVEQTIKEGVESEEYQARVGAQNAAAVIMDPRNGEIISMVGSRDVRATSTDPRFSPQHNAALSPRSMGSTTKPANNLAAFRIGYQPGSIVPDYRVDLSMPGGAPYYPVNNDRRYSGYGKYVTMRTALRWSLNVPAVATFNLAGMENFIDTYTRLNGWEGIREQVQGPAAPLGAANIPLLEQTHAYATMASVGMYHEKKVILEIFDAKGDRIYDNREVKGEQKIDPKFVYLINDMNQHYWTFDSNPFLANMKYTMDVGGKTGTGDREDGTSSDVAFMIYTPTMTMGFWSGNSCGATECPLEGYQPTSDNLFTYIAQPVIQNYLPHVEPARFQRVDGISYNSTCLKYDEKDKGKCVTYSSDIVALPPVDVIPNNEPLRRNW